MTSPVDELRKELQAAQIELADGQIERLAEYCRLRWEWNERLNLTRHTDFHRFVVRDLADTLVFSEHLAQDEKILDVGSGSGVPGLVLAVIRPDLKVTLSESVAKRAKALEDITGRLGVPVTLHHARAEDLVADESFDTLVIRAVAPLRKLLDWFAPHWAHIGRILAVKGPAWVDERADARHRGLFHQLALRKLAAYPMADHGIESVLLEIRPK
ncbi:MAG: 16S rRNA (guanine(527)-N(7))-methyltransferase RsmG [Pirellulales bacterium]|nr:16S rRNA (guanine(527)-N(7))-methyltransferase RsmG [Pirellulales bacterium]